MFLFILIGCFVLIFATFILNPMAIIIFVAVSTVIVKAFYPQIKGYIGEKRVHKRLLSLGGNVHVFHDVYIEIEEGHITQIDHIVVSNKGIFIIETKNYTGWIFGNEKQRNWTQIIYKNRASFYNPILQNRTHIKAVKKSLNVENGIYSIIVFSNAATFKFKELFLTAQVIKLAQLRETILKYQLPIFTSDEVEFLVLQLANITANTNKNEIKRKHLAQVKNVQKNVARRTANSKTKKRNKSTSYKSVDTTFLKLIKNRSQKEVITRKCPTCGRELVERNGKYGMFFGCKGFPECKYTEKINKELTNTH